LVASGVYVGAYLAVKQGRKLGMDEKALISLIFWSVGMGFVGAHVLDVVFYYPERLLRDPLSLFHLWDGLSSFGGFCGAFIGALLWKLRYQQPVLPYIDVVGSAFPLAWVFGRSGCSIAHDHPGLRSELWFAVQYPRGGRFDLGLYEMWLSIPIAITFLILRKKARPWGYYTGLACVAYAPSRFGLDFLRASDVKSADPRYAGFTPAQWACFGLLMFGVWLLWNALESVGSSGAFAPPRTPPARVPPVSELAPGRGADGAS
jgi:phosphatidylglycerol:prolipoprotein diacylglycerol transferase